MKSIPIPTRKAAATTGPCIPAVQPEEAQRSEFGHGAGRHMVVDHRGLSWPNGNAGDVLDIDFDVRDYHGEGLYLLYTPPDSVRKPGDPFSAGWTGIRRITKHVGTTMGLHMYGPGGSLNSDEHGWSWQHMKDEWWAQYNVLGKVHDIYRRAGRGRHACLDFMGRLTAISEALDGSVILAFGTERGRTITIAGITPPEARQLAPEMMNDMKLEFSGNRCAR